MDSHKDYSGKLILLSIILIPLIVLPGFNLDPVNVPKLAALSSCGFGAFISVTWSLQRRRISARSIYLILAAGLVVLIIPWLFSRASLTAQFYGAFGRNIGILTWFSLLILGCATSLSNSSKLRLQVVYAVSISGFLVGVYGLLQSLGLDPISWISYYQGAFSTMGNPNFFGAMCGMSFGVAATYLFYEIRIKKIKSLSINHIILLLSCTITVIGSFSSKSLQGPVLVLFSLCYLITWRLSEKVKVRSLMTWSFALFAILGCAISLLLRMLNSEILIDGQRAISERQDFMYSGVQIIFHHPFFGVGFDQFGDWYRFYRSTDLNIQTNSSHNMFLDFGAGSGLLGLLTLITLCGFVSRNSICWSRLKEQTTKTGEFHAISLGWILFMLQSMVNVNSLGNLTWGAVFAGLLLANQKQFVQREFTDVFANRVVRHALFGVVLGLAFAFPLLQKDHNFYRSQMKNEIRAFENSVYSFPQMPYYFMRGAEVFEAAGYHGEASKIAIKGVEKFPTNLQLRIAVKNLKALDGSWKRDNLKQIQFLDPPR
jgi:hypothetical protein